MDKHKKKMIAPIAITAVLLIYLIVYAIAILTVGGLHPLLLLLAIPIIALGAGLIYVLRERLKEIRSGEEDDLSNY